VVTPASVPTSRSRTLPGPGWAYVTGLFLVSALFRFAYAVRDPAPWIFNDEINYSELAQSLAYTGAFAMREVPGAGGFGVLYPILIAPAYVLFDRVPDAYDALRAINSLLMSLTVVPVYLLARRLAGPLPALAAAAFSVAIPALMFTGQTMTENAFYPIVAFWMLAAVRILERPTFAGQLLVLALIGLAFLTRPQAVILAPVLVASIGLLVTLDARDAGGRFLGRLLAGLRAYWVTWALLAVVGGAAVVRQALRGEPLNALLGSYGGVTSLGYEPDEFGSWALYHLAELDIAVGVFPLAAFIVLLLTGLQPSADRAVRIFACLGLFTVGSFLAVVTAFASSSTGDRILERNFFHVSPLLFVALAGWLSGRVRRPWWAVAPAAMLAGSLTLALPVNMFLNGTIVHSTPGLLPIWRWRDRAFSVDSIDEVVACAAIAAAVLFVLVPRALSLVLVAGLAVYFAATTRPVESFTHQTSNGSFVSALGEPRDWIDQAVGRDAKVASLWVGGADAFPYWESEYFNRSVGAAYTVLGAWDGLVHTFKYASLRPDGTILELPSSRPLRLRYVLTDEGTTLRGKRIAQNGVGTMSLFEVGGPVAAVEHYEGLFPDRWSGTSFVYRRYDCEPGMLRLRLENSNAIHRRPFTVQVLQHGSPTDPLRFRVQEQYPSAAIKLVPLRGSCEVVLQIPTGSAEASTPGDFRQLGLRFLSIRYDPSR